MSESRCAARVLLLAAALLGLPALPAGAPAAARVVRARDPRWGVRGDGRTDDTAALQRALDAAAGATLQIPKGIYRVNALVSLRPRSRTTLLLAPGAVLKALPNGAAHSAVVLLSEVEGVTLRGGTVEGERSGHTGQDGEWGHGIALQKVRQVALEEVTARECWGDGVYVAGSEGVVLRKVVADHNRRQGLSVTSVKGLEVRDCVFRNTSGTLPEDGIDLEPNPGETVEDVLIHGCQASGNSGFGIEIGVPLAYAGKAWISRVTVEDSTCAGNGVRSLSTTPRAGIEASNCEGVRILRNTVSGNGFGILLRNGANGFTVSGNTATGNTGDGIHQYLCSGNTITDNRVGGNGSAGIRSSDSWAGGVKGNTASVPAGPSPRPR